MGRKTKDFGRELTEDIAVCRYGSSAIGHFLKVFLGWGCGSNGTEPA
jgi:hypothetical protein